MLYSSPHNIKVSGLIEPEETVVLEVEESPINLLLEIGFAGHGILHGGPRRRPKETRWPTHYVPCDSLEKYWITI